MPHYQVAVFLPKDFDPATQDPETIADIHALNRDMIAAGVRRFAGGLGPARAFRTQPGGEMLVTDGPYLETKELVGGLWILEVADEAEARAWARRGAEACRAPVELREIFFSPAPTTP
ncbi:MAG: YciI family protein [Gemmatimonadales bacterium]